MSDHDKKSRKPRRKPRPQTIAGSRRALRLAAVEQKTGLKRTQILDAVKRGIFPKPFHVLPDGRAQAWDEYEIDSHLEAQMAARNKSELAPETV